jgi:hypothetical protein
LAYASKYSLYNGNHNFNVSNVTRKGLEKRVSRKIIRKGWMEVSEAKLTGREVQGEGETKN